MDPQFSDFLQVIRHLIEKQNLVVSSEQHFGNEILEIIVSGLYKYLQMVTMDKGSYLKKSQERMCKRQLYTT